MCLLLSLDTCLTPKERTCKGTHPSHPSPGKQRMREEERIKHSACNVGATCILTGNLKAPVPTWDRNQSFKRAIEH